MHILEQVSGVIGALQTFMMVILAKLVSNVNLRILTILAKRLILIAWMGPGLASAGGHLTVLEIQSEMCKDGRRVKRGSF